MLVNGRETRSIRLAAGSDGCVFPEIIDQTRLPHELRFATLRTVQDAGRAIREMWVRGAPLIGATAGYGIALATRADASDAGLQAAARALLATRPTAVNLGWVVRDMLETLAPVSEPGREAVAFDRASAIAEADVETCRSIGEHGEVLLIELAAEREQFRLHLP